MKERNDCVAMERSCSMAEYKGNVRKAATQERRIKRSDV